MKRINIPTKFNIPFGNSAGGGFITNPIPEASQIGITDGRASLTTGFPPLCFLPTGAGGVPPYGSDVNGILFEATSWDRWFSAGGPIPWDSAFSAAVGGYPQGAIVQSTVTIGLLWISIVDDNTTNPDIGGANWRPLFFDAAPSGQCYFQRTTNTTATLVPQGGDIVKLNGVPRKIPAAGIMIDITNCYVNGTAGQTLIANTDYNVYLFEVSGTLTLGCRTGVGSGHIASPTAGNVGVEVRNASGTPDNTETLVGKINPASGPLLSAQGSNIVSWFNKRQIVVAGLAVSTPPQASTSTYVELISTARVGFLSWGTDVVMCDATADGATNNTNGGSAGLRTGPDGVNNVGLGSTGYSASAGQNFGLYAQTKAVFAEGFHYNTVMGATGGVGVASYATIQATATLWG